LSKGKNLIIEHLDQHAKCALKKNEVYRHPYATCGDWLSPSSEITLTKIETNLSETPKKPTAVDKEDCETSKNYGEDLEQEWDQDQELWVYSDEVVRLKSRILCNICSKDVDIL
jgi:hypothetical protein